ncbi:hypothetical protein BDC45DRAFT_90850 [Circinella umbellata]|nr:hypothetical protein BDC45DRAFT_90850 [Circinella umbellata]
MEVLDGVYLKGDHTFKIIKLINKINGQPVFTALYTVLNEYEEVRLQFLVPTKALSNLQCAFETMRKAYDLYGYAQPQIFFTDNVTGDQNFLKNVLPSLSRDVVPVTEEEPQEPLNVRRYPLLTIPNNIDIKCIRGFLDIETCAANLINNRTFQAIGFDCEWPYNTQTYQQGKIATIQIADNNCVLVLCVSDLDELPSSLCKLLGSESVVKLGRGVNGDLSKIQRDFKIVCKGGLELGAFCKGKGVIHDGRLGLAAICEAVLEHSLDKDQSIRLGSWDAPQLTQAQISWASLKVVEEVNSHGVIGMHILEPTADDEGNPVSFHPGSFKEAVAYGEISKQQKKLNDVKVSKGRVIVKIKQVLVPGAMITAHDKCLRDFGNTPFEVVVRLSELRTYKNVPVQQSSPTTILSEINRPTSTHQQLVGQQSQLEEDDNDTPNESDDDEENVFNQVEELAIIDEEGNLLEVDDREIDELSRAYCQQQFRQQYHNRNNIDHQASSSTSINPVQTMPIHSRILKDVFHLTDMIKVSRKHGLSKAFSRAFRDTLFVIDKDDKRLVKTVLENNGTTWEKKLAENPNWIFHRVKRVVPPPEELYPLIKKLFETYGPLRCARTERPLFDFENWRQAKNVLSTIHLGHVSDSPNIRFYFVRGRDKDGLTLYRCSRGTNSLEGGIHQNLIRSIGAFGASVEYVDALLADYRLKHNIDVGMLNRFERVHDGHYDPWISQHINNLESKLNIPCSYSGPGIHAHSLHLNSLNELFGISPIASTLMDSYNIAKSNPYQSPSYTISSSLDIAILIIINRSTAQVTGAQYKYIAECQKAAYAIISVHTDKEKITFNSILRQHFPDHRKKSIDFLKFTKLWSQEVNGIDIFYKTPEQLNSYYTKWKEIDNIKRTKNNNKEIIDKVSKELNSSIRKRASPPAQYPSPSKAPRTGIIRSSN